MARAVKNFPAMQKTWIQSLGWRDPLHLDVALIIPLSVGPYRGSQPQGTLLLKNYLKPSVFKQCVTLSMQDTRKDIFLRGRKGIQTECVFRPLLAGTVAVLRCENTRAGLRA